MALLKQFSMGVVGDSFDFFFIVLAGENVLGSLLKTWAPRLVGGVHGTCLGGDELRFSFHSVLCGQFLPSPLKCLISHCSLHFHFDLCRLTTLAFYILFIV